MIELKPCPFCGGGAGIDYDARNEANVKCKNKCVVTFGSRMSEPRRKQKAKEIWNRRTIPKQNALTIDELRKMIGEPVWIPELNSYAIVKCDSIGKWANIILVRGTIYSYGEPGFVNGLDFEYDVESRALDCYRHKTTAN